MEQTDTDTDKGNDQHKVQGEDTYYGKDQGVEEARHRVTGAVVDVRSCGWV